MPRKTLPQAGLVVSLVVLCLLASLIGPIPVLAQGPIFTEDFTDFTGSGFQPTPGIGQLDSDVWRVIINPSGGVETFGGTHTTGDFARGTSPGGVIQGGIYGFEVGGGNIILGVQPTEDDFTPGNITLRVQNNTGAAITQLHVSYNIWYLNDEDRANFLNFSHSPDDMAYTPVPALDFTTPEAAGTSGWQSTPRSTSLTALNIANGAFFYLKWMGDDVGGSGFRDEYGIDNVQVAIPSDLGIIKSVNPTTPVAPGQTITYTLVFSNAGPAIATDVVITDVVPVSLTVQSVISSGVTITPATVAVPTYTWRVQDLAQNETGYITLTAKISDSLVSGLFTNTATITSTAVESNTTNNRSQVGVTVRSTSRIYLPIILKSG